MSLAVAGLVTHGLTLVHDAGCIADSFPGFVEMMQALGANMEWMEQ
jgi:5-enolpyruvylshikimate-3-phosphate synthase